MRTNPDIRLGAVIALAISSTAFGLEEDHPQTPIDDVPEWTFIVADGSRVAAGSWSMSSSGVAIEIEGADARGGRFEVDGDAADGLEADPEARVVFRPSAAARSIGPHLLLQSGERFPGRPDLVEGEIVWRHGWLGELTIDLDELRSLVMLPASAPDDPDSDVVTLANGDRIDGFVVAIGSDIVVEHISDGSTRRIPFDRMARVDLVGDRHLDAEVRLWTLDGTVVDLDGIRGVSNEGEVEPDARMLAFDRRGGDGVVFVREILALAWRPETIRPLAGAVFEIGAHPDAPERTWIPAPTTSGDRSPLDAGSIELTGPARFETMVPKGSILSTEAELPEMMRRFGDFELRILDGDRERLRRRFSRGAPRASIAVPIESGRLVIELGPGMHGPVQDRLRLTTPLLVRSRPASE